MEQEGMRQQFPYYNDLQAIFTGRMQRMLWMELSEGGGSSKKRVMHLSSDDDDENDESDVEKASGSNKKKKKIATIKGNPPDSTNFKEILEDLLKQQMQMETQWMKIYEVKEEERRKMEMEWRRKMEALENERIMHDQRWREREEQRRIREDTKSEKQDALITALLNKLRRADFSPYASDYWGCEAIQALSALMFIRHADYEDDSDPSSRVELLDSPLVFTNVIDPQDEKLTVFGNIKKPLMPYHVEGIEWLWSLHCKGEGGILASDMGVDVRIYCLFKSRLTKRVLVVPTTLLQNWSDEFYGIGMQAHLYHGTRKDTHLNHVIEASNYYLYEANSFFCESLNHYHRHPYEVNLDP
ncbi:trihelix transcription factor GT-3b [Tanacetum coccineum]